MAGTGFVQGQHRVWFCTLTAGLPVMSTPDTKCTHEFSKSEFLLSEASEYKCPVPVMWVSSWVTPVFPVSFLVELACMHLRGVQGPAVEVETKVATTTLGLETEVKLPMLQTELQEEINLLKIENRNLHEKLQWEIRLKEDLEKVSCESFWRGMTATSAVTLWEQWPGPEGG